MKGYTLKMNHPTNIAVIVIPTYNEAENIGKMIEYLNTKTFLDINNKIGGLTQDWQMKILVVDGNSPDGTGKVVQQYSSKYPNTSLLTETSKDGLGAAYFKGFKYAMEKLKADFVFEFDADFQHPPETIPGMLKTMEDGYDYVIGSRKIKGGEEPKGRDLSRMLLTEVGGLAARFILFFPFKYFFQVTDPTTGLKITRVKGYLDKTDLDYNRLYSKKFGYKVQLLLETLDMGAKFKEVPLQFQNRESGQSKFEPDTSKEILWSCIQTRWNQPFVRRFVKFGIVGGFGFIINAVGARFFKSILLTPDSNISIVNGISNALAAELAIISNFTWNNLWTFSKNRITSPAIILPKFLTFNLSSLTTGIAIPSTIIAILTAIFGDQLFLYQVIAIFGLTVPLNWIIYNKVIWKTKTW